MPDSPWFRPPDPAARLNLITIPFAGGGIGIYRTWQAAMPEGVSVVPVELPGRERRLREPALTSMSSLVQGLVPALLPIMDKPFVIFGHSMGAAIAYEVARAATQAGRAPLELMLSARRAPQLPAPHTPLFALPKAQLLSEIERLYGAFPAMLKKHPHLLDMFVPTMRADFQLLDTWQAPVDVALDAPILAFAAEDDHAVPPDSIDRWRELTRGAFGKRVVPGGHFCVRDRHEVRDAVAERLSAF